MEVTGAPTECELLSHKEDSYHGVIIDAKHLPSDISDFTRRLDFSLTVWKLALKRGVWLKIPIGSAHLIDLAVQRGFAFHHAEKDYLMLTQWLSEEVNHLPNNATHQVGVGCVVFNSKHEMLLVQERNGILKGKNVWKFPTGLLDLGEDIPHAAVREVLEETGIATKFSSILCFRQLHNIFFGKSDLFFVCLLELENEDSVLINFQQSEIEACSWGDAHEYFKQPFMQASEIHRQMNLVVEQHLLTRQRRCDSSEGNGETSTATAAPRSIGYSLQPIGLRPGDGALYTVTVP